MKIAKVCKQWELPFNFDLKSEENVSLHNRSYLHYAADHQDMVATKAWATKWLLEDIVENKEYTAHEYMAGIGIQSLLIQKLFKIKQHIIGELDEGCIEHLSNIEWGVTPIIKHQNAFDAAKENDTSDLKFLDVPNSSILQMNTKWKDIFFRLFESKPELVVWTDTSVTYPMSIHGERYSNIFSEPVSDKYSYAEAYSRWLDRTFGYKIKRAAFRGKNAVYFAAVPSYNTTKLDMNAFPLADTSDGFYFIGEERNNLESFF